MLKGRKNDRIKKLHHSIFGIKKYPLRNERVITMNKADLVSNNIIDSNVRMRR
jgi:hypothetical protein